MPVKGKRLLNRTEKSVFRNTPHPLNLQKMKKETGTPDVWLQRSPIHEIKTIE